jgi:hypothetical protein
MCKLTDSAAEVARAAEALVTACLARTERRTRLELAPGSPIQRHLRHAWRKSSRTLPADLGDLLGKLNGID